MTIKPKLEYYKCGYFQGCFYVIIFSTLKRGQIYLQTWPLEAKLGIIFPEIALLKPRNLHKSSCLLWRYFRWFGNSFMPRRILLH